MIAALSNTRCEPSVIAGMRPLGLIFKNQLWVISIVLRGRVRGSGRAHSSFWMLVLMSIGTVL